MIIYTWMRFGQTLKPKVLEGVAKNNCELAVLTSRTQFEILKVDESNAFYNRKNAIGEFLRTKDDIFLGMDSDVVLYAGIVIKILDYVKNCPVIIWPDKHNFFAINRNILQEYPFNVSNKISCAICQYFDTLKLAGINIENVSEEPVHDDH